MPTYQQDIEHSMQLMRRALEENADRQEQLSQFAEMEERIKHSLVQIHHDHDQ